MRSILITILLLATVNCAEEPPTQPALNEGSADEASFIVWKRLGETCDPFDYTEYCWPVATTYCNKSTYKCTKKGR